MENSQQKIQLASIQVEIDQDKNQEVPQRHGVNMAYEDGGTSLLDKEGGSAQVAELQAKVKELEEKLKENEGRLRHKEEMVTKLKKRVAKLTVATPDPLAGHVSPQDSDEKKRKGSSDSDKGKQDGSRDENAVKMEAKVANLRKMVHERERTISELTAKLVGLEKTAADTAKIVAHSKNQSRKVLELREQLKQYEGGASAESPAQQVEAELQALQKSKAGLATALAASQHENEQLKSRQTQYDTTIRQLKAKNAKLDQHVLKLTEQAQAYVTSQYQETEKERQKLEKRVGELMMTLETLQAEKKSLVEQFEKMEKALQDSQGRAQHLATTVEQMKDGIQKLKTENFCVRDELEAHKLTAATFKDDFDNERKEREQAHSKWEAKETEYKTQVETLTNQVDEMRGSLRNAEREARVELGKVNDQLQLARARIEDSDAQIRYYQEELRKTGTNQVEGDDELGPFRLHFHDPLPASREVGSGCYGIVYAVEVDGVQCIAKRVQDILLGEGGQEDIGGQQRRAIQRKFRQECILLSKIRHPNIVQFMGVRYGRDMYDLTLVMERLPMDLQKCLESCKADKPEFFIPLSIRFSILLDVTYGLLHLHNRSILHRDLTAGNILLTSNLRAKIADLGVSRIIERRWSQKLSTLPGTIGYMPPEALTEEPVYNLKLDVFSFGVLALFVALQEFPNFAWVARAPDAIAAKGETELYKRSKWISKIGNRHFLYPLIHRCLQDNSDARPSTAELNAMIKRLSADFPRRVPDINKMLAQLSKLGMSDV